jgi:AcrR family transcriptional regulator
MAPRTTTSAAPAEARPGLRERKKRRTADAIRSAATRLFLEQGYDATTTEQIAEAADVSPSTFFRYFPTKESVLLRTTDGVEVVRHALEERPADEPVWQSLRHALLEGLPQTIIDPDEELARIRIAYSTPSVRGAVAGLIARMGSEIADAIRPRLGRGKDADLRARVMAGAVCSAIEVTQDAFVTGGAKGDAFTLLARALDMYGAGLDDRRGGGDDS